MVADVVVAVAPQFRAAVSPDHVLRREADAGAIDPGGQLDAVACAPRVAFDLSAESVDRGAPDGQRRHRQPPPPVFGGGGQFEAELADLSAEFADLAAQPLDVGAGGQVDRMQNPRRHAVEGGGDGGAGLGEDRAEFGVAARADERFSRGARRFSIASYAS